MSEGTSPYFKLGMDKKVIVPYAEYLAAMKPDFDYVGDKAKIKDVVRTLFLPNANSVKLVAKKGAGITSIIDGLVQHQHSDFMPNEIMTRPIFRLNGSNLFNTSDAKTIEARFRSALDELKQYSTMRMVKPVLVIDDGVNFVNDAPQHVINTLIEADVTADFIDLIIGVDEKKEKDFDAKHPEFTSSFTVKKVEEPKNGELFDIVKHYAAKHKKHGVIIDDATIEHIIDITQRFKGMYNTAQPNRAIRLLNSAATAFRIDIHSAPPGARTRNDTLKSLGLKLSGLEGREDVQDERESLESQIKTLEIEIADAAAAWEKHRAKITAKQADIRKFDQLMAEDNATIKRLDEETKDNAFRDLREAVNDGQEGDPSLKGRSKREILDLDRDSLLQFAEFDVNIARTPKIRELKENISRYAESVKRLQKELDALSSEMHIEEQMPNSYVDTIASDETKSPVGGIGGRLRANLLDGVNIMKKTVFGQDHVLEAIIATLRKMAAGLSDADRPLGVFMIPGPPGSGKTYTGEQLAEQIFGGPEYCRIIKMENYQAEHSVAGLIGAPAGYAGYEDKPKLVQIAEEMPFGVLILDEIEKAHPVVRQNLLNLMGNGRFDALNGESGDFRNIVIVSTSNYAQDVWLGNDFETGSKLLKDRLESDHKVFSPEFRDRHDEIICAKSLDLGSLLKIASKHVGKLQKTSLRKHPELYIDVKDSDIERFIAETMSASASLDSLSGRRVKFMMEKQIANPLTDIKLGDEHAAGVLKFSYNPATKQFDHTYEKGKKPANENKKKSEAAPLAPAFSGKTLG